MTTAGLVWLMRSMSVEAERVVVEAGHVLTFCDWRMAFTLGPAMESGGWRLRNLCVWDKGSFGLGTGFRPQHEMVLHLTRRAPLFHSHAHGNVLRCSRVPRQGKTHPTEKPVDLLARLVDVTTPRGGAVLDPFMGAGSTGVACMQQGRSFVGIEKDARHFDEACRRLELACGKGVAA
jgi:site-specific DNA-methyltransferase (adenine-specific)